MIKNPLGIAPGSMMHPWGLYSLKATSQNYLSLEHGRWDFFSKSINYPLLIIGRKYFIRQHGHL